MGFIALFLCEGESRGDFFQPEDIIKLEWGTEKNIEKLVEKLPPTE